MVSRTFSRQIALTLAMLVAGVMCASGSGDSGDVAGRVYVSVARSETGTQQRP